MSERPQPSDARAEEERRLMRERLLRILLTSEARERLTRVKMVKPDVAQLIEDQIIQMASTGRLKRALSDEELKQLLLAVQQPRREFRIRRI